MEENQSTTSQDQNEGLIKPETVDQFALMTWHWHSMQVATVKHYNSIPEGTEVEMDGEPLKLEGEALKGFKVGLQTALAYLGTLPFTIEPINDGSIQ